MALRFLKPHIRLFISITIDYYNIIKLMVLHIKRVANYDNNTKIPTDINYGIASNSNKINMQVIRFNTLFSVGLFSVALWAIKI